MFNYYWHQEISKEARNSIVFFSLIHLIVLNLSIRMTSSEPPTTSNMPDSEDSIISDAYDRAMRRSAIPENLLYLVRNSEKEIKRNRLQAMIRLKNHSIDAADMDIISDHFYAVHDWPNYAIEIVLSSEFKRAKRLALAAFMVGNGLYDAALGEKIFKCYNKHCKVTQLWNRRFMEFRELFKYLNKPDDDPDSARIRSTYYYFSMECKQTLFFNGEVRHR